MLYFTVWVRCNISDTIKCLNYTEVLVQNLAVESASQFYMEMHGKLRIYMY